MGTFAASVNCIDGRVQAPIRDWIRSEYGVDFVDVITEPGSDKALGRMSNVDEHVRTKLNISIRAHKSEIVFVSGHHECAANPVSRDEHIEDIRKAADKINSWNLPVKVIGLWINDSWNIERISIPDSQDAC